MEIYYKVWNVLHGQLVVCRVCWPQVWGLGLYLWPLNNPFTCRSTFSGLKRSKMQDFDQKIGGQGCYPCTPIVKGGLLPAPFLVAARAFWPLIFSTLSHHLVVAWPPCRSSLQLHFIDAPCGCSLPLRLSSYVVTPVFFWKIVWKLIQSGRT